jgi:hypothetical protein
MIDTGTSRRVDEADPAFLELAVFLIINHPFVDGN